MQEHKVKFSVVAYGSDGKATKSIELTQQEYESMERAMQWPEDLAKYDRLNKPISGAELGMPI